MMFYGTDEPLKTYKSYKKETFERKLTKARMLRQSVSESSLKDEDKKALIELLKKELCL